MFSYWNRKRSRWAATLILLAGLAASGARADVVTDWNTTAQGIIAGKGAQPGVYYAMMHAAIYDAVNAVDGRYSVFAVRPVTDPRGASVEAAAASSAYRTLLGLFPDQSNTLDAAYAASLAAVPDGTAKTLGIAVGEEVAAAWLALRAGDGREAPVPYVYGTGPGAYQRTPPALASALAPWMAKMRPFTLHSPSQFRAYGPPDLTSHRYAMDVNAVKSLGGRVSTERTAEESEIALFYTENPTIYWGRNIRALSVSKNLSVAENARLFAMVFIGFGDAVIACWDSKYYFNRWRPVTAIQNADSDGNDQTTADPTWQSFAITPPHPEYPAAHACATASIAEALASFFKTRHMKITFTSTVPGTVPHDFYSTEEMIEEVKLARVLGGMHYPTSSVHGAKIGRQVAEWISDGYFKRVRRHD